MEVTAPLSKEFNRDRTFELIAGHPALDLVNTLDWRFREAGSEELLDSFENLLRFTEQSKMLPWTDARRILRKTSNSESLRILELARQLREAVAEAFYAAVDGRSPTSASVKTLKSIFKTASERQELFWLKSRFVWEWPQTIFRPELPLWLLSRSAEDLLTSDEMEKLRACGNSECRWLFLDTSKNHTRRWCDMKICGNRMKARRFKAQHRA